MALFFISSPSPQPLQVETTQEMTRIVGLSATLPNFDDVADFLRLVWECCAVLYIPHLFTPPSPQGEQGQGSVPL